MRRVDSESRLKFCARRIEMLLGVFQYAEQILDVRISRRHLGGLFEMRSSRLIFMAPHLVQALVDFCLQPRCHEGAARRWASRSPLTLPVQVEIDGAACAASENGSAFAHGLIAGR